MPDLTGLYFITDAYLSDLSPLEQVRIALECGVKVIQYREKKLPYAAQLEICRQLRELSKQAETVFIVNDSIEIAKEVQADGVHLGQEDDALSQAQKLLPGKIIGVSASTVTAALVAAESGASYIGFGAIFPTPSKPEAAVTGLEALRELMGKIKIPVVAIGGINRENLGDVLATGCQSVAVLRAVLTGDLRENLKWFSQKLVQKESI